MHLLYVHRGYFPALAGAENMVRVLADVMRRRGHAVTLVVRGAGSGTRHSSNDGVHVVEVASPDPQVIEAELDRRVDLVHAVDLVWPEYAAAGAVLARRWSVPFVVTPASTPDVWQELTAGMAVCLQADAVCVLTDAERQRFAGLGVPVSRLHAIGQGPLLQGEPDPTGFRTRAGLPPEAPVILFLGRKARFKGYRELLASAPTVWERWPEARFVFAGPRWDADCADVFGAFADPRVVELDTISEVDKHSALQTCDMLCLPTRADVFPLVLLEAWACAKPVVVAPFAGLDEIVRDGVDAVIAQPEPGALAAAIVTLLDDPARRAALGTRGRAQVKVRFNWTSVGDRVLAAYARCAFTSLPGRTRI